MSSVGDSIRVDWLLEKLKGKDISNCTIIFGTCKDCRHRGAIYTDGKCYCNNDGTLRKYDFCCKDFKMRGSENG